MIEAYIVERRSMQRNTPSSSLLQVNHGSARSILLTILGEFVYPEEQPVWTSTLLHILTGVGVEEKAARQAIARGAAAGWITSGRSGREVCWHLTPAGRQLIKEGAERVESLSADSAEWDCRWLILIITVPESNRVVRRRLYSSLSWAGFGNPTPGIWISPHPEREGEARRVIDNLKLSSSTFSFVGSCASIGLSEHNLVKRAWNLGAVEAYYEEVLDRFKGLQPKEGDPILFTHVQLVNQWQRFPFIDPQLPDALLPTDWIGRRAAVLFREQRAAWHDAAHARWHELTGAATTADRAGR
jgi:phenylacetic acid degradation operon negative regulatory protein